MWRLLRGYYDLAGPAAFLGGEVPFAVTSGGQLSCDAAALLLASDAHHSPGAEPIRCLELGPGTGLFAKLLLDDLERCCRERRSDCYDRITLVLADSSRPMLDAIASSGLLAAHEGRYELLVINPPLTAPLAWIDNRPLHAVFLNYVLDSLPASVIRRTESGIEHLCVRTRIAADAALSDYTDLSPERVTELAHDGDPRSDAQLGALFPALAIDARFEPAMPGDLPAPEALGSLPPLSPGTTTVHSHGAIACLHALGARLAPGGFALFSDFPSPPTNAPSPAGTPYSLYGGAIALGLNFGQIVRMAARWDGLSHHATTRGAPTFISRLIGRAVTPSVAACFEERFSAVRVTSPDGPLARARKLIEDDRLDEAWAALTEAHELAGRDWGVHEAAAAFLAYLRRDRAAAREVAIRGLELNPLSTSLWNVLGDCHLHARDAKGALDCYERAIGIHSREVRGRGNAAIALTALRRHDAALTRIAEALALDDGDYRERLLGHQARILDRLARRRQAERERSRAVSWF